MKSNISFLTFWQMLLLRPKVFFQQYLAQKNQRPYFGLIVTVFCAITLLGTYRNPGISVNAEDVRAYDQDTIFLATWLVAFILRLLLGVLSYFMLGWVTKLLVSLSGGTTTCRQARSIAIYTYAAGIILTIPSVLFISFIAIIFPQLVSLTSLALASVYFLLLGIYLTYIEYCGVIVLTGAQRGKAIFWFCVFPCLLVALLMLLQLSAPTSIP